MGKNSKLHLCDSCNYEFAECGAVEIEFGDGYGNDNVIFCDAHNCDVIIKNERGEVTYVIPEKWGGAGNYFYK